VVLHKPEIRSCHGGRRREGQEDKAGGGTPPPRTAAQRSRSDQPLPDQVLGNIITLLSTREGARTQAVSRRWRPLWRAAPLNLQVDYGLCWRWQDAKVDVPATTKILAGHAGPGRRFVLLGLNIPNRADTVDGWLRSRALTGLREIRLSYSSAGALPPSALRFAATLRVAKFGYCHFPNEVATSLKFPHLRELSLFEVTVSEEVLHSLLSGCYVLEILLLERNAGFARQRISSPTLRSIGFSGPWEGEGSEATKFQELVVEDAPRLERLLPLHPDRGPATVRVMS